MDVEYRLLNSGDQRHGFPPLYFRHIGGTGDRKGDGHGTSITMNPQSPQIGGANNGDDELNSLATTLGIDPETLGSLRSALQYRQNVPFDSSSLSNADPSVRLVTNAVMRAGWSAPLLPAAFATPASTSDTTPQSAEAAAHSAEGAATDATQSQFSVADQEDADMGTVMRANAAAATQDVPSPYSSKAFQPLPTLRAPAANTDFAPAPSLRKPAAEGGNEFNDIVRTVGVGDTVEKIARQYYPANYRAGTQLILDANGISRDKNGSPIIGAGGDLFIPDQRRYSSDDLDLYARSGGQAIAANQSKRDAYVRQADSIRLPIDPTDGLRAGPTLERLRLRNPEFAFRERVDAEKARVKQGIDQAISQANLPKLVAVDPDRKRAAAYDRLRAKNDLEMAVLGPFAGSGLTTRALGGDENAVAAGNEFGAGLFGIAGMAGGIPARYSPGAASAAPVAPELIRMQKSTADNATKLAERVGSVPSKLYHYTNEEGLNGILASESLNPSLREQNPNDVRYGNGQYMSDIQPGSRTPSELSRDFLRIPWQGDKFSHFIELDMAGLNPTLGRTGVYVIPNEQPLDLKGRIKSSGRVTK